MEKVIFVELLDRREHLQHRFRVDRFPLTLGRAYTNDIILEDRYVSPEHVSIHCDESGKLIARDLNSRNGMYTLSPLQRKEQTVLHSGSQLRIGRSVVRFLTPDHELEPTLPEARWPIIVTWLTTHWSAALLLMIVIFSATSFQEYSTNYIDRPLWNFFYSALALLIIMAIWAGAWSLVSRLLHHRARFVAHWMTASGFICATLLLDELFRYACFFIAPLGPVKVAKSIIHISFGGLTLFGHLTAAGVLRPAGRALAAGLTALALFSVILFSEYMTPSNYTRDLPYWSNLTPLDTRWLPKKSVKAFFDEIPTLKAEVDALAEEKK